jgi:hypothetical protein
MFSNELRRFVLDCKGTDMTDLVMAQCGEEGAYGMSMEWQKEGTDFQQGKTSQYTYGEVTSEWRIQFLIDKAVF